MLIAARTNRADVTLPELLSSYLLAFATSVRVLPWRAVWPAIVVTSSGRLPLRCTSTGTHLSIKTDAGPLPSA